MKILKAIYSIYVMLWFVILLVLGFPFILLLTILPQGVQQKSVYALLKFYAWVWSWLCFIFPINYFANKIEKNKNYVICANHQSYYDPVNMYCAIPFFFKALGKIEISKMPLFGKLYEMAVIPIDRSSVRASAASFINMRDKLMQNIPILIYPEATFPDIPQDALLAFKDGAFTLATKGQADVLPLLFLDTAARMNPISILQFSPGRLRAVFLPPIAVKNYDETSVKEFNLFTKNYMQACLDFCRNNKVKDVWTFAEKYLQEHKIVS